MFYHSLLINESTLPVPLRLETLAPNVPSFMLVGSSFDSLTNIVRQIYSLYVEMLKTNGEKEVEKGPGEKKEIYWDKSLVSAENREDEERERLQKESKGLYIFNTYTQKNICRMPHIFVMHAFTFKYNLINQYNLQCSTTTVFI